MEKLFKFKTFDFRKNPVRYAFIIAAGYIGISGTYLISLGGLFPLLATSITDFYMYDLIKDVSLIVVTSIALFWISFTLFQRLYRRTEDLLSLERRAMAGTLSLAVIHDINNLLTIAEGHTTLLHQYTTQFNEQGKTSYGMVKDTIHQLIQISERIKMSGKSSLSEYQVAIGLTEFVRESIELVKGHQKVKSCEVKIKVEGPVTVLANPALLQDSVINLILNAGDATGGKGIIEVRVFTKKATGIIEVHDNGPGIPEELRERIFESFYTTKKEGTGLGLISVRACAETHGGKVMAQSSELGGACVRLEIPALNAKAGGQASAEPPDSAIKLKPGQSEPGKNSLPERPQ